MKMMSVLAACGAVLAAVGSTAVAQEAEMSFFVTSQGPGDGANLGGLDGAETHCQQLAESAGAGEKPGGPG